MQYAFFEARHPKQGRNDLAIHGSYEEHCAARNLRAPPGLTPFLSSDVGHRLDDLLYRPDVDDGQITSLTWALDLLNDACLPPPPNLLPLLPVDDASIACAVCASQDDPNTEEAGYVVRWHLSDIDPQYQGVRLDVDAATYVESVAEELAARQEGLRKLRETAKRYYQKYVVNGVRPHGWVERPVQLACQNVIIGLATLRHDAYFDGVRVPVYLTCEVPHLATHEANRAMVALLLCDAFQNGGTMEIRFGLPHNEEAIPAALRRFGRSLGLELGADDANAISPAEARDLFLAVTPMPDELRGRTFELIDRGIISPERLCYTLLASVWRAIELDYIVTTSSRVASILEGGAPPALRRSRLAELEVCRAALMAGMLFRRLDSKDRAAQSDGNARVFEDGTMGIEWSIREEDGAFAMTSVPAGRLPWSPPGREPLTMKENGFLIIVPRALPSPPDHQLILDLEEQIPSAVVALLVPADIVDTVPAETPLLLCPDRLSELDAQIESKLLSLRIGRA